MVTMVVLILTLLLGFWREAYSLVRLLSYTTKNMDYLVIFPSQLISRSVFDRVTFISARERRETMKNIFYFSTKIISHGTYIPFSLIFHEGYTAYEGNPLYVRIFCWYSSTTPLPKPKKRSNSMIDSNPPRSIFNANFLQRNFSSTRAILHMLWFDVSFYLYFLCLFFYVSHFSVKNNDHHL